MKNCTKVLGKVSISVEGNWDINKEYDRLCIVKNLNGGGTYLSKINVPKGIEIGNDDYWQFLCGESSVENLVSFDVQIVDALPEIGQKGVMYLVKEFEEVNNLYSEYIWISNNNKYEKVGSFNSDVFTTFKNEITEEIADFKKEVTDSNDAFKQEVTEANRAFQEELNNGIVEIVKDYLEANIKFTAVGSAGTKIGTMKIGDVNTDIYVPFKICTFDDYTVSTKDDIVYFITNG